jgi:hypothetical protein
MGTISGQARPTGRRSGRSGGGGAAAAGWTRAQAGFGDDCGTGADRCTLQGDACHGTSDERPIFGALRVSGANLLGRCSRSFGTEGDFDVRAYHDLARSYLVGLRLQLRLQLP